MFWILTAIAYWILGFAFVQVVARKRKEDPAGLYYALSAVVATAVCFTLTVCQQLIVLLINLVIGLIF